MINRNVQESTVLPFDFCLLLSFFSLCFLWNLAGLVLLGKNKHEKRTANPGF